MLRDLADEGLLGGWGGGVGSAEDEHVGGIVAEGDAVFFEGEDDAAAEFAEDAVTLVGADADLDRVGDGAAFDLVDAEDVRVGDGDVFEGGIVADAGGDGAEEVDDFVGVGAGVDRDVEGGEGVVAGEVGDGGDLAVGDDVEGSVAVAEGGTAEGEVFDGAFEACEDDDFTDVVLVFDEDEDAVEHVLEDGLRAEADADADDAGGGEDGLVRDVEDVEELEEGDESEDAVGGGSQDGGHGAELGGAVEVADLAVGAGVHLFDEEEDDPLEHEDDDKDSDDSREFFAYELDDAGVPLSADALDDLFVLRARGQKEHDDCVSLSERDAVEQSASDVCWMQVDA